VSRGRRRTIDEAAADRAVMAALRGRHGAVTRADLVVATALPEMVVERSLERLLDQLVSTVSVGKGGVMRYRFAEGLPRRAERRAVLRALLGALARAGRGFVRGARAVFRAVLAVQLLVYVFVILVPISAVVGTLAGLALLVASIFSEGGAELAVHLFDPYVAPFILAGFALFGIGWAFKKKYELLLELVGVRELDVQSRGVDGLVARVAAFALGSAKLPPRAERLDRTFVVSIADERRLLARIRARGGRLRAGDLVKWLGLSLEEAEAQATRLFVEYGGELPERDPRLDETDVEVVEFRFPRLVDAQADARLAGEETRFERDERPPPFTGNQRRHDLFVGGFALLNLVGGLVGLALLGELRDDAWYLWAAWLAGGVLPVFFSTLMFGLPLLRSPVHLVRLTRGLAALARARGVRAFVAHAEKRGDGPLDLEKLAAKIPESADLPRLSPSELRAIALQLGGEFDLDSHKDPTKTVWRFRRLAAELSKPG
jgi:hypothetical protein